MRYLKRVGTFLKKHWKITTIASLVIIWVGAVLVDAHFDSKRAALEKQNEAISELEKKKQVYDKLVELKAEQDAEKEQLSAENSSDDLQMGEYNSMNPDPNTIQKREEARQQYKQELIDKIERDCKKLRNDNDDYRKKLYKKLDNADISKDDYEKGEKIINDGWEKRDNEIDKFCEEQLKKVEDSE